MYINIFSLCLKGYFKVFKALILTAGRKYSVHIVLCTLSSNDNGKSLFKPSGPESLNILDILSVFT